MEGQILVIQAPAFVLIVHRYINNKTDIILELVLYYSKKWLFYNMVKVEKILQKTIIELN